MALSESEIQVLWSAASSSSVSAGGNATSDEITFDATAVERQIQVKADNGGTPASGDELEVWLLEALGDPDGASTDEFETAVHGTRLGLLDTNAEDPAIMVVPLSATIKKGKLRVENKAASNSITVSACVLEKRSS